MDRTRREPDRLPILVANGFAPFPIPLHLARGQFRAHGFRTSVMSFRLSDMRDAETYAAHVADATDALLAENGADRLHLVGYSMGGVAALIALKRLGLADRVATFVGLGAPFNGSRFSWFGMASGIFSLTGQQLAPNSAYLKALHEDPLPRGPRYLSVAGSRDLICPPSTALLDGTAHRTLPIGHAQFIIDQRVTDLVVRFLR